MKNLCLMEQIDIAPTIAEILKIPFQADGKPISEIVEYGKKCVKIVLLIIDALGYSHYLNWLSFFTPSIQNGKLYKCKINADKTTPAIASILSGRKPENHKVYKTEDVYKSKFKSILEVAVSLGFKIAVVMEEKGALTFKNRIDLIKPVKNKDDIIVFDEEIKKGVLEALSEECDLITAHFRILDKLSYKPETIKIVNKNIISILKECKSNSLIIICGDHPPHNSNELHIPVIAVKT
ncbi:sulfatase [Candidatus Bathyarchaeota archaeon]|nr:sulfatase [Candidatus Bathyarchaeota archaeon]